MQNHGKAGVMSRTAFIVVIMIYLITACGFYVLGQTNKSREVIKRPRPEISMTHTKCQQMKGGWSYCTVDEAYAYPSKDTREGFEP